MATLDDINRNLNAEEQQDLMPKKMKEVLETPTPEPKKDDDKPVTTYSEMYAKLNPRPSDEELAAERKRQRRNALIAAIGDGISAIANMYYAGKGAPSSYDPKQGLSAKLQERYDKINAERRAHDKEWRAGYARAQALDQQALAAKERNERMLEKLRQQQEQWQEAQKLKERAQSHREDNDRIRQQQRDQEIAIRKKLAGKKGSSGGSRPVSPYTVIEYKNGREVRRKERTPGVASGTSASSAKRGSLLPGNKKTKGSLLP